jgi:hypothetical protein
MTKYTPLRAENELKSKIHGFHDRAKAAKEAYYAARKEVLSDERLSPSAQQEDLAKLTDKVAEQLKGILEEQQRFVDGLKATIETQLRGSQPTDANSVLLRRDASQRARKIDNEKEALAVLRDAISSGDESLAHAIGYKARQTGWFDVAEAWKAAHPETAGLAEALAFVEDATSGGAFNLSNSMAYAAPAA